MGQRIAVVGFPTKGKSTSILPNEELSIEGLKPSETVIITFSGKQLPVRGANKLYPRDKRIKEGGNFYHCEDIKLLPAVINFINKDRPEVKNIVLEDMQYSMAGEYLSRINEKGYDKFTAIAKHFYDWMKQIQDSRDDLFCWVIWHPEVDNGIYKMKTLGKLIDQTFTPEGLMDHILYADCEKGVNEQMDYYLVTNNDGVYPARTAPGMFKDVHIKNDLGAVRRAIEEYYN